MNQACQEGKYAFSNAMDRLSRIEHLIHTLEAELSREDDPNDLQNIAPQYNSVIKFDGTPILPPVLTQNRREEMQFYKEEAMMREAKMKTSSHKKLLETVQQVLSRLGKKKDYSPEEENQQKEEMPKKVPPDKQQVEKISPTENEKDLQAAQYEIAKVPSETKLPEAVASPRSAVGDSGISSDFQQLTSPRAQMSTLETMDTLAEITDMSTDFETDIATGSTGDKVADPKQSTIDSAIHNDTMSSSETGTLVNQTEVDLLMEYASKNESSASLTDSLSEASVTVQGKSNSEFPHSSQDEEEVENNTEVTDKDISTDNALMTKNNDCSQGSSDTLSVTVISKDRKDPQEESLGSDCELEDQEGLVEEPKMVEIDAPPITARSSCHSQTDEVESCGSPKDSLEQSDQSKEAPYNSDTEAAKGISADSATDDDSKDTGNVISPFEDSLELGSTLLSRVALSDNEEDTTNSTLEESSDAPQEDASLSQAEKKTVDTADDDEIGPSCVESQGSVNPAEALDVSCKYDQEAEGGLGNKTPTGTEEATTKPELFPGQTQKLMVLQKLNTLLEQVETKTGATKPKSILRTPEKYSITPSEVVSPGPDHTPDVSVISYAESGLSSSDVRTREYTPVKSSSVVPKPAISPHPKVGRSPPSASFGGQKSQDTSMVQTASTELGRYMAESVASMDTINSVSTLPHTGVTGSKNLAENNEHAVLQKQSTSTSPKINEQKDLNQSTRSHRRQGSYTLDKPSTTLLQSSQHDISYDETGPRTDLRSIGSSEERQRPVHRKLQYDKENTPPTKVESRTQEKLAKEEHLQRYLQQVGQMPQSSPPQQPPSITPTMPVQPAEMLHDQMKYFEQMKDHMMLMHQQQLGQMIAEQQRQQLLLQQQFLQQEHQLRQQLSMTLGRESQLSQSTLTPEVPPMSMTLPMFGMMPGMPGLPTVPADMATSMPMSSMTSFSLPGATNLINSSFASQRSHREQMIPHNASNTSLHQVPPNRDSDSTQQTRDPSVQRPSSTNNSPRVCFSTDTSATPAHSAQATSPGVQVHYYTPEHSSPPSPEVATVLRRPSSAPSPVSYPLSASPGRFTPDVSRRPVEINLESLSDNMLHKFNRVTAAVRGYLTRRLLKTQKVQQIITTIRDTAIFALNFQAETPIKQGVYSSQDIRLQDRVLNQLTAAMYEINEIFVQIPTKEKMALIAQDRELLREKRFKEQQKHSAEKKVSAATKKALDRKKRARLAEKNMLELSFRPKSAPPSARSPRSSQSKPEDISGPIKRNYQFMISRAMPKSARNRRSGNSPLKPVKDNINRSVLENSKMKKESVPSRKTNANVKRTNTKQDTIVRKTVTLSSKESSSHNQRPGKTAAEKNQQEKRSAPVANKTNNNNAVKRIQGPQPNPGTAQHSTQKSKLSSHWK